MYLTTGVMQRGYVGDGGHPDEVLAHPLLYTFRQFSTPKQTSLYTTQPRLRLLVADVEANADEPAACVEIASDREDAVTPAIAEAAHLYAGEFQLPRLQLVVANLCVELFQIAMWPVVHTGAEFPGLDPGLNGLGESVNLGVGDVEPTEVASTSPPTSKR